MLGKLSLAYMFKGYAWLSCLRTSPYKWDPEAKSFRMATDLFRKHSWRFVIGGNIFATLFLLCRTVQTSSRQHESPLMLAYYTICTILLLASLLPVVMHLNLLVAKDELPEYHRQMLLFFKSFKEKYEIQKETDELLDDKIGLFIAALYHTAALVPLLLIIVSIVDPSIPVLFTSLFECKRGNLYMVVWVVQFILYVLYVASWFGMMFLYALPGIVYIFNCHYILKEMQLGNKSYTTESSLRTAKGLTETYQSLQVLHTLADFTLCRYVLLVNKWSFLMVAVYCIYGTLQMEGLFALCAFIGAFIILVYLQVVFTFFANMNEFSGGVIESWKGIQLTRFMRKYVNSLRPVVVKIGRFYLADRHMLVTMLKFVFESTIDLLCI